MSKRPADPDGEAGVSKRARALHGRMMQLPAVRAAAPVTGQDIQASTPRTVPTVAIPAQTSTVPPPLDPVATAYMDKQLDDIFKMVVDDKRNVFVTGPAGSGKSWLIKKLVDKLSTQDLPNQEDLDPAEREKYRIEVMAPTGSAALNVGGFTCDAFMGLNVNSRGRSLKKLALHGKVADVRAKIANIHILIIDEISMVSNESLIRWNVIVKEARQSDKPFGGLRVIAVGDFAQLPPVKPFEFCIECGAERVERNKRTKYACHRCKDEVHMNDQWAFKSPVWAQLKFKNVLLEHILRQQDPAYKSIVHALFLGNNLSKPQLDKLRSRDTLVGNTELHLYPQRKSVDEANASEYEKLPGPEMTYTAYDHYRPPGGMHYSKTYDIAARDPGTNFLTFLKDHPYQKLLRLKIGTPVVLIANINKSKGLVNGKRGVITGWVYLKATDVTFGGDLMDDTGLTWDPDDGIVDGDWIPSLSKTQSTRNNWQGSAWFDHEDNQGRPCPIVKFSKDPTTGEEFKTVVGPDVTCKEYTYGYTQGSYKRRRYNEDSDDEEESTTAGAEDDQQVDSKALFMRTQLPLLPAWAMTIHRSQGLTMDNYVAHLRSPFCSGLEYVALTRATKFESLAVEGLRGHVMRSAPPVREFLKKTFPDLKAQMQPN